jgi:hypothetical protein
VAPWATSKDGIIRRFSSEVNDDLRRFFARACFRPDDAAALLGISAKTMTKLAAEACPGAEAKRGRRRRKPLPR